MKTNNTEQFEIIRFIAETDEEEILATFETKEEALAYGEKLAENFIDEYTLACVSDHVIGDGHESCVIHEVWDTLSDRILKELEEDEHFF